MSALTQPPYPKPSQDPYQALIWEVRERYRTYKTPMSIDDAISVMVPRIVRNTTKAGRVISGLLRAHPAELADLLSHGGPGAPPLTIAQALIGDHLVRVLSSDRHINRIRAERGW